MRNLPITRLHNPQSLTFKAANQLFNILNAMSGTPALEVRDDALSCARVEIAGSPNFHRCGAGEHELHDIASGSNAAHADYRDIYRMCRLIHHPERNRLNRRSGK